MIVQAKIRIVFKVISCLVAGIFLFQQIAWAGDLIDVILHKQADNQAQVFAPAYLKTQQTMMESAVSQKQDVENFQNNALASKSSGSAKDKQQSSDDSSLPLKGPRGSGAPKKPGSQNPRGITPFGQTTGADSAILNVTTSAGDIINYKGSAIDSIQKKDGAVLHNIAVDASNNLVAADITYTDGTCESVRGGKVVAITKPDGTFIHYDANQAVDYVIHPDKTATTYDFYRFKTQEYSDSDYSIDVNGNIVTSGITEMTSYYDTQWHLGVVEFKSGKRIQYYEGIILSISEPDNSWFSFTMAANPDGSFTSTLSEYMSARGAVYSYSVDKNDGSLSVTVENGDVIATYDKDGALIKVTKNGKEVNADTISKAQADYDAAFSVYQQKALETEGYQAIFDNAATDLADAQNTLSAKETILNNKIADVQTIQALVDSITHATQSPPPVIQPRQGFPGDVVSQPPSLSSPAQVFPGSTGTLAGVTPGAGKSLFDELAKAKQDLIAAQNAQAAAQTDYNNTRDNLNTKQAAYDEALANLNNAISDEDSASAQVDVTLEVLNTLKSASSMFPSEDTVLADANKEVNILDVHYDAQSQIEQVTQIDGTIEEYSNGLPTSVSGSSGSILYNYDLNSLNGIDQITVDSDGIKEIYDQYGNLSTITADGVSMAFTNGNVSQITKADGTIIQNAMFDGNNDIISATVINPDGTKAIYDGGVVREIDQPNGSKLYYDADGKITNSVSPSGISYTYTSEDDGAVIYLIATADNAGDITDPDAIIYQKLDSSNTLIQAKKKDGTIINYTYTKDGSGKILTTEANDGKSITTYDADNNITKVEVLPTADDPVPTVSNYEYNQIRTVYKGGKLVYNYTYETDNDGNQITVIQDVSTGDVKRYKDGVLISLTDVNNVITSYEYNADGKISQAIVTNLGQVINTYTYTYDGDNTIIQDIDGIIRTYDKDNKLISLEQNGKTYQYTYKDQADGTETTIQDLASVKDDAGVITNYSQGSIVSIVEPDGTVITDIVLTGGKVTSYTVKKDGITYFIVNDKITKQIKADGMVIEYDTDGLVTSVNDPAGKITQYTYERDGLGQIQYITAAQDSVRYIFDKDGNFLYEEVNNDRFYYDASNRLVEVMVPGQKVNYDYIYSGDDVINIMTEKIFDISNDLAAFNAVNMSISDKIELRHYTDLPVKPAVNYYRIPANIGTGSDGAKHVTANETLALGTYNFTSLTIEAGCALTAAAGTTINCLGAITVNGTLSGANLNINAHTITVNTGGAIVGLGQSLKANTINNAGTMETLIGQGNATSPYAHGAGNARNLTDSRTSIVDLGGSYTISKLVYQLAATANTDTYSYAENTTVHCDVYLLINGVWVDIYTASDSHYQQHNGDCASSASLNATSTGNWANVTAIKAVVSSSAGSDHDTYVSGSITTLQAYVAPTCEYINKTGRVYASSSTTDFVNALKYYEYGWIGQGGIRSDILAQMPTSPSLLDDLYHGDRVYDNNGTLTSNPISIAGATDMGYIDADVDAPAGTSVTFKTRTGASSDLNDGTWSGWTETTKDSNGYKINSSVNKYVQYQAVFTTSDITETPSILFNGDYAVKLTYGHGEVFDATAPPADVPFRDFLILPLILPIAPNAPILMAPSSQVGQITSLIENKILPDDTIIETQSSSSSNGAKQTQITLNISKDSKITTIIDDKPVSVYQQYDDGHMVLLTEYTYDADGNLISINLPYARESLEDQLSQALNQIAAERESYLAALATQKGCVITQIEAQFAARQKEIDDARVDLEAHRYEEVTRQRWVGWWIFGWMETYTETIEVPGYRDAVNQLDDTQRQLDDAKAQAYAKLNGSIQAALTELNTSETSALTAIQAQQTAVQAQIIYEETAPVVINYYREILGRDPSDVELAGWVATVNYDSKIDVGALKTALLNSAERAQDEAFIAAIKGSITDALYAYVAADDAGKAAILSSLGLSASDAITLNNKADADAILALLDKQNIHFGRSAFVSLQTLLSANSVTADLNDLARKTILIDIFTGSFNALTEGNLLELSMYSLNKTASLYGVIVYNAKLNYADLIQAFNSGGTLIAHLKNNHYVDVTNISGDGKITYVEHNKGQNGSSYTVSEKDFENGWTGYAITKTAPADTTKIIPAKQAQRIKGSCLFFLFPLIGAIIGAISAAVTAAVAAISAFIATIITTISSILVSIISSVGALFTGIGTFLSDIGGAIFSVISFVGDSLLPGLGTFFGNIGSFVMSGLSAFGSAVCNAVGFSNLTALGTALGKTIVTTALSICLSKGLDAIGLNPIVSNLISSFVTGGVAGLFNNFTTMGFIGGALQGLAIQTVSTIGQALGIPPNISSIIGMAAGSLISAGINGVEVPMFDAAGKQIGTYLATGLDAVSYALDATILPNVARELVCAGVTELGDLLGVDPRISYLAGIGLRSTLLDGLMKNPVTGEWTYDANRIWTGVETGLLQGVTSIGLNYATQELGLDPLLANLGFSAIASVINASIQTAVGQASGENVDFFKTIFDTYINNALTFLNYSDTNSVWQQSAYLAQVQDFSNIVKERGLVDALNTYAAGFFNAVAVDAIVKSGVSIGDYFSDRLKSGQYIPATLQDGSQVAEVAVTDAEGNVTGYVLFEEKQDGAFFYWDVVGKKDFIGDGSSLSWGDLGVDDHGKLGYTDAEIEEAYDNIHQSQKIVDGQQAYVEIKDASGKTLLVIEPTPDGHYNVYNSYGEYVDAKIQALSGTYDIDIKNSMVGKYLLGGFDWISEDQRLKLKDVGYSDSDIDKLMLNIGFSIDNSGNPVLQYGLTAGIQMLSDVSKILGSDWLSGLKLDADVFYQVSSTLLKTTSYSSNTRILSDPTKGIAAVDMLNLDVLQAEEYKKYAFPLALLLLKLGYENTIWDMSVKDAAPEISKLMNTTGINFAYVPGNRTVVNDLSQVEQMRDLLGLGTDKRVVVGWSAGTEAVVRSWATTTDKSIYYILVSPRMSADTLAAYATAAGIDPSKILIVNAKSDWSDWSWGYGNGAPDPSNPYERIYPWTHVFLNEDTTDRNNQLLGHSGPIDGWLADHSYKFILDGEICQTPQSLIEIYKRFLKGEL